jgi:hypothetical protein
MSAHTRQFRVLAPFAAALTVLLLAGPSSAFAQEKTGAAEKEEPRGGPSDGIKVHGHWTIDVKNPDGSLASRHEFENALDGTGAATLSRLLTHSTTQLLGWGIVMFPPQQAIAWSITEPPIASFFPTVQAVVSTDLTVAVSSSQLSLVLQGSVQAPAGSSIAMVATMMVTQEPINQQIHFFTERQLAQPISVQANQIIQVTVTLSFS